MFNNIKEWFNKVFIVSSQLVDQYTPDDIDLTDGRYVVHYPENIFHMPPLNAKSTEERALTIANFLGDNAVHYVTAQNHNRVELTAGTLLLSIRVNVDNTYGIELNCNNEDVHCLPSWFYMGLPDQFNEILVQRRSYITTPYNLKIYDLSVLLEFIGDTYFHREGVINNSAMAVELFDNVEDE